jgi:tetratricopeptide (TPR) repeat protein
MSSPPGQQGQPLTLQQFFAQAVTAHEQGQLAPAEAAYRRILAGAPDQPDTLHMLGLLMIQTGRADAGFASIDRALRLRPDFVDAHFNRGLAMMQMARFADALPNLERAATLAPRHTGALANAGMALIELGRPAEAIVRFDRVLALDRANPAALAGRAVALSRLQRSSEALEACDRALAVSPGDAEMRFSRGAVLQALGRPEAALESFDAALKIAPQFLPARVGRGAVLKTLGRLDEALADDEAALAVAPNHLEALINRGLVLHALHRFDEALASFDRALSLDPGNALAAFNRSLTLLLTGRFEAGWPGYERRFDLPGAAVLAQPAQPPWDGKDPLDGKTLLVQAEQGLGDTIQFCRFASLAADRGAQVVLSVQAPLAPLLTGFDPRVRVAAAPQTPDAFDHHCALMSLPGLLGATVETLPGRDAYLTASPEHAAAWAQRLGERGDMRIGLAWSGGAANPEDRNRSIPLALMAPLLADGGDWFCLQTDVREPDRAALAALPNLTRFDPADLDFVQTAALIAHLDLVVTVDTSIAHLSAALGKPTWILSPFTPDWRWLLGRADSPWYAAVRLFRQSTPADWSGVVGEVRAALAQRRRPA